MATINKTMKTFNVPSGSDTISYEIFDDKGRKCIAKDWYANSTAKFSAGEYVIKDGVCYKFKVDHPANSSWSASEVVATNLGSELSDVKSALTKVELLRSKDHVSATDFTTGSTGITYSTNTETGEITVTNGGTASYALLGTPDYFPYMNLVPGRVYRIHAKIEKVSGSPNPSIGIRGISGNADGSAVRVQPDSNGEAFIDFVATPYMRKIVLYMAFGSSTKNSVAKFSKIWLREYSTELDNGAEYALHKAPLTIFGIKQPINVYDNFYVRGTNGQIAQSDTDVFATDYIEIPDSVTAIKYMRMALTSSSTTLGMAFYNSSKVFISGELAITNASASRGEISEIAVPSSAKYARFTYFTASTNSAFIVYAKDSLIDKSKTIADNYAKKMFAYTGTAGKAVNYKTGEIADSSYYNYFVVYFNGETKLAYTRLTTGLSTSNIGMAFYDSNDDYISGKQIGVKLHAGYDMSIVDVPEDAVKARISWWNDTNKALYAPYQDFAVFDISEYDNKISVERFNEIDNRTKNVDGTWQMQMGLHTKPESIGVLNVIKRCRQMTDIKWTPAVDLPRLMMVDNEKSDADAEYYEGVFKAGTEYTGIPYGRANDMSSYNYSYGYVGKYIDFDTFVTSVSNPESMLCKESAFDLEDHESTKYAAVCSALVCHALNVAYYTTANIPNIPGLSLVSKINDNGTLVNQNEFHLGDILNLQAYHTAVITDIVRNADGNVTHIELSEATVIGLADKNYADGQLGGLCRRKGWTIDEIYNRWGRYSIYRYANIDSIPYTPSDYVNVGDELNMIRFDHFPCMPYPGEGFKYKSGHIPNTDIIISPNLGYDKLRVFKDDEEFTGSPFTVTSETAKVSVGFSATGDYEAYLCTMSDGEDVTRSLSCHWSVVS